MKLISTRAMTIGALGLTIGLGFASPAFAHSEVVQTLPADGSTVGSIDKPITVTANEDLLSIGSDAEGVRIVVADDAGLYYGDGCVTVDAMSATEEVALTEPGHYTVAYRIISADGHPVTGSFEFTLKGDGAATPAPAYRDVPECGTEQTPINTEPTAEPTLIATPMPISETDSPAPASPNDMGIIPWIGLATVPVLVVAIWLLVRTLGKRNSEDDAS